MNGTDTVSRAPTAVVRCVKCKVELPVDQYNHFDFAPCPGCHSEVRVYSFPALQRGLTAVRTEQIGGLGEASCFYHSEKKAVVVCDGCGRFLCGLCEIDFDGKRMCTQCLHSGQKKKKFTGLEVERTRHDRVALALAFIPILFWVLTILTAPATLIYCLYHWNSPGGLTSRNKRIAFSIAMGMAVIELIAWGIGFVFLLGH